MLVKNIEFDDLLEVYNFNEENYAERQNAKSKLDFWFGKKPNECKGSIILKGTNKKIAGQILSSSMIYYNNEQISQGNWIFDYIVHEDLRKDGYGIDLLQFALRNRKAPIFAAGSGSMALKIELKMGFKLIGEIRKYVGISHPFYILTSIFRSIIPTHKYPEKIKLKSAHYKLIDINQLPDYTIPFNTDMLEFGRNKDYLKWRFYSDLHDYAFYKHINDDDFFVVRTIVKNNITCLVLVDYRCNHSNIQNYCNILNAVKKLAWRLRLLVIITGSTLGVTDSVLEKNGFKSKGRARPIISTENYKNRVESINNREFVFVTLADSDGEINW